VNRCAFVKEVLASFAAVKVHAFVGCITSYSLPFCANNVPYFVIIQLAARGSRNSSEQHRPEPAHCAQSFSIIRCS
jgi:hypothetical protein